jgi:hypothetical protein
LLRARWPLSEGLRKPKLITVGTASVTIRAVDNGGTANGGSDSSVVRTLAITII